MQQKIKQVIADGVFIDCSITNTGIVAIKDKKLYFGNIKNKDFSNHGYLNIKQRKWLKDFLDSAKLTCVADKNIGIDICLSKTRRVYIEGAAYGKPNRAFMLGQFNGIVLSNFEEAEIKEVPPKSHKKTMTGNGNASKEDTIASVKEKYGLSIDDDNVADAISIMDFITEGKYRLNA